MTGLYSCLFSVVSSLYLHFSFPPWGGLAFHSGMVLQSLSSFSLVITILLGQMPTWTVCLFLLFPFSVDDIFFPVNLNYFASVLTFMTFLVSSHNLNLFILSDGHRLSIGFLSQLCRKRGRHNLPGNLGGGGVHRNASIQRHKKTECFDCCGFSNNHEREEVHFHCIFKDTWGRGKAKESF